MKKQTHRRAADNSDGGAAAPRLLTALLANASVAMPRANGEESSAPFAPFQYIRLPMLLRMVPWSASTVWRKVRDGSFPRPVKLSSRITAWNRQAVQAWLAEREAM